MQRQQNADLLATKSARTTRAFVNRVIIVLLILFTSGPIAGYFLIYQPLREAVETNLISNFAQLGVVKHNSFREAIRQYLNRSQLVSDRAMIRRAMESYIDGQMGFEELQVYSAERYEDFVSSFNQLIFTNRYIGDEFLLSFTNDDAKPSHVPFGLPTVRDKQRAMLDYDDGAVTLYIYSPVRSSLGKVIGYDILAFDFSENLMVLSDESSWVDLLPAQAFDRQEPLIIDGDANVYLEGDQYVWTYPLSDKLIFAIGTEAKTLLQSLNKLRTHIIVNTLIVYAALIFIIVFYIVRYARQELLLRDIDQGVFTKAISDAKIDYLTAIGNRRCAEEVLNDFYARFGISGEQPPVILFDIDGFKAINDSFGHATGDDVLISITQAVLLLIGDAGHLFRWGGDEFLLIASAKSIVESETVARQVLSTVGRLTIKAEDGEIKPTISMGISTFASEDQSYLDAVARADRMMYQAKSGLGNSYELAL